MTTSPILVLAIDIEMSGPRFKEHDILAIGSVVMNENFEVLDIFFVKNYNPDDVNFEEKCWTEFWTKDGKTVLKELKINSKLTKSDREKNMIYEFMNFVHKWEILSKDKKYKLDIVSDNPSYDIGTGINSLIEKYLPECTKTLIYDSDGNFRIIRDTDSIIKGILIMIDPKFVSENDWGYTKKIRELYNVPKITIEHNHLPHNDAYNIAFDYQITVGIMKNKIKLRD